QAKYRFLPVTTRQVRVVNNTTHPNYWTVAEMRVFLKGTEIPRDPRWQVSAWPNEWEARLAFDNNYTTRWSTWEAMRPGARIGIAFREAQRMDGVVLHWEPAWEAKLKVEFLPPWGRWVGVTDTREFEKVEPPQGVRRAAALEVKALGF